MRDRLKGLYAITPECADTVDLVSRVERCLEGGAALVQYRAKSAGPELALEQAKALVALCRSFRVPLIVNDSIELAAASGADGVHLGRDDARLAQARSALPRAIVGVSCYGDPSLARIAARDGADYVGIGSVFTSPTKPHAVRASLAALGEARRLSGLPVAAIGGITLDNADEALAAGADMLAVITALFDAPDVRGAARAFSNRFDKAIREARGPAQQRAF
ncbi:MAG TPA: thiamine phosphate synthase [Usitatibacter sp.]|nr:thiamine phosphate synthase [Usitatibacter sp.]